MKALKILGAILLGIVGLAVLLYFIGVAVNWRDQPPSTAALEMRQILADRPTVADVDNGFPYLMGFSVPAGEDPEAAGVKRMAWIEAVNQDTALVDADPVMKDVDFVSGGSKSMKQISKNCNEHGIECRDAFAAALPQPRLTLEELQLARYRELLRRPKWREVVPIDVRVPLPRYRDVMVGQRLLFVDLAARAKSAPAPEILREIRADIAFWREVQKSSDFLITRMISIGAIRQHFFFANLVLREIPAGQAEELIAAWSVPFSVGELSLRRTMAGELSYAEGNLRHWLDGTDTPLIASEDDPRLQWTGRIGSTLARPYFQPQDQFNHFASMYLDVATRFEVPLDQYSKVRETFLESDPPGISYQVYNLTGHILRGLGVGMTSFTSYPMRVGSIEGMRRGALVTAQLRERGVPQEQVAAELKNAELRDPFHLVPFEWNEDEKAVIYTGPESEGARYRHPYFY